MPLVNALLPLIRTLQVTSLSPFSVTSSLTYVPSKRFTLWSLFSIVLLISLFVHGSLDSRFYTGPEIEITNTIVFIKLCSVQLAHIIVLIESFMQRKSLIEIIETASFIDSTLMKKLGVDVGHKDLKKMLLNCLMIGSALFVFIESSVLAIFLNHSSRTFLSFCIASSFSLSVICLRYLHIISFIYIIQSRLTIINYNLNKIDAEIFTDETRTNLVSVIGHLEEDNRNMLRVQNKKLKNFDEITILRDLFGKLWDVSKLINGCFGASLVVCVGNDFGTVLVNGYWMYLNYNGSESMAITFIIGLWSVPHLMCLLLLSGFCYTTVCKANETALIVHKIDNNSMHGTNIGLRTRIQQFSIQLLHQRPAFNACGFFDINFTLIYTIIGAMTTYLIILIQFQMMKTTPADNHYI